MKKLFVALTLCITVALLCFSASAEIVSGNCGAEGDNVTWTFDTESGELVISGEGEIADYSSSSKPWYDYRNDIINVNINSGVTTIGDWAFSWCTSLASISVPDGVTIIGECAFYNCTSLASIEIPERVTTIGDWAFNSCTSLASIEIPEGVTGIGECAFYNCVSLASVYISDIAAWCNISFDYVDSNPLYNGGNLYLDGEIVTDLIIPEGVTTIGANAFYNCTSLASIEIPDGVTSIGFWAFSRCTSLASIDIPEGVTTIGNYAFYNCTSLEKATVYSKNVILDGSVFHYCNSSFTIYGYTGSTSETYANENNIPFIPLAEYTPGDSDGDGNVTIRDAARILQYKADWDVEINLDASDVDGDGNVTIRDAARILQYKAGWDVTLG